MWSREIAALFASALRREPDLRVIVVVPRFPDRDGIVSGPPHRIAQLELIDRLRSRGGWSLRDLRPRERRRDTDLRPREDGGDRRRLGGGRIGQPESTVLDARFRAVDRRAGLPA